MNKLIASPIKEKIIEELKQEIKNLNKKPKLTIIVAKNYNQASTVYVNNKIKICEEVGIDTEIIELDWEDITKAQLLKEIKELCYDLNRDEKVTSYFVQLPLPHGIVEKDFAQEINIEKDTDAFNPSNLGLLFKGQDSVVPCTPAGIMDIFDYYNIDLSGKDVVIVNRSQIVGIPLIALLLQRNATVQVCHSKTKDLKEKCRQADVVITAVGKANFMDCTWFNTDAIVVDVSMNRDENGKLCGDVRKDHYDYINKITPVPGSVGIMTTMNVVKNVIKCAKLQENKKF